MSKVLGDELSQEMMRIINNKTNAVLATASADSIPNTTPIHLLIAYDSKTIRLALWKMHDAFKNICENKQVSISILENGDNALSISGEASIEKQEMDADQKFALINLRINKIKSDRSSMVIVISGIKTVQRKPEVADYFEKVFKEMYQCGMKDI